ncbi:hypothetical protein O0L34_g3241 [Tuta absoluta]|nr:hypothetical protein O0L34_g3241 [Tuta absoluta]
MRIMRAYTPPGPVRYTRPTGCTRPRGRMPFLPYDPMCPARLPPPPLPPRQARLPPRLAPRPLLCPRPPPPPRVPNQPPPPLPPFPVYLDSPRSEESEQRSNPGHRSTAILPVSVHYLH